MREQIQPQIMLLSTLHFGKRLGANLCGLIWTDTFSSQKHKLQIDIFFSNLNFIRLELLLKVDTNVGEEFIKCERKDRPLKKQIR